MEFGDSLKNAGNNVPTGIWSDWTTMWVADNEDDKLFAYDPEEKTRVPAMDFNGLKAAGNENPQGIWSDGTTMWVADSEDGKLYAYLTGSRAWDPARDFDGLGAARNRVPSGIWSDGTTMWVADHTDGKLYAYDLATKERASGKDFDTLEAAGNENPTGIWSDGTTIWVADSVDARLYVYNLEDKTRVYSATDFRDFDGLKAAGNIQPRGIWSDGTTMWVADDDADKLYAYDLATKARDSAKDFDTLAAAFNNDPWGIWSDGTTMWVSDYVDDKLYAYDMTSKARVPAREFETLQNAGNIQPRGIWSDGATMWVADFQVGDCIDWWYSWRCRGYETDGIFAYFMPDGTAPVQPTDPIANLLAFDRDPESEFGSSLYDADNDEPMGIWSDDLTIWVADSVDVKLYAYDLDDKVRVPANDFDTLKAAGNESPQGIWSDGTTMWVVDEQDDKLYAYDMATKARDSAKDFATLRAPGNREAASIWSDGTTMWVSDNEDDKLYAYDMTTKERDSAKDFATLAAAGNNAPWGIWSDGTTMWVSDNEDDKLYAYGLASKARVPAREFETLRNADNLDPMGIWSDGATMWVADFQVGDCTDRGWWGCRGYETDGIFAYFMPDSTAPGAAVIGSVSAGAGSLTVSWDAPPGNPRRITAYDLRYIATADDKTVDANWTVVEDVWSSGSGLPLQHKITGLTDGTQYDVQVRAINSIGHGRWSATVSGTPVSAPPGTAAIISVTADVGSLSVSWNAPPGDAGGITAYDLRHIPTADDETVDANWTVKQDVWTAGSGALQYNITGLTGGTQYDVQVRAVNSVGDGPWSTIVAGTPRTGIPATGSATRSFSPATVAPGGQLVVTISAIGYGPFGAVVETLPSGFTYVSGSVSPSTVAVVVQGQELRFTLLGQTSFTYTATAPNTVGAYAFSGLLSNSGGQEVSVGGAVSATVGQVADIITRYDKNGNGTIERDEVIQAINDFLFDTGNITREDVIQLINAFLFG